jgi:hypothetical protein
VTLLLRHFKHAGTRYTPWQCVQIAMRARRLGRIREYRRLCNPGWLEAIRMPRLPTSRFPAPQWFVAYCPTPGCGTQNHDAADDNRCQNCRLSYPRTSEAPVGSALWSPLWTPFMVDGTLRRELAGRGGWWTMGALGETGLKWHGEGGDGE